MGGWRIKLIFLLIVYFAGFATAVYCLAPVPEGRDFQPHEKGFVDSALKSNEFALSFNAGMHKVLDFSKDIAYRAARFIKQRYEDRKTDS